MKHIINALKISKRKATHQRDNWKRKAMVYRAALAKIAGWSGGVGVKWPNEIAEDALTANSETVTKNPETTEDEAREWMG